MSNLGVGTPRLMKLCGHTGWLIMGLLKYLRINWYMELKLFFPENLNMVLGV